MPVEKRVSGSRFEREALKLAVRLLMAASAHRRPPMRRQDNGSTSWSPLRFPLDSAGQTAETSLASLAHRGGATDVMSEEGMNKSGGWLALGRGTFAAGDAGGWNVPVESLTRSARLV